MKIFYNPLLQAAGLTLLFLSALFCTPVRAADYKSVLSAIESGRDQGVPRETLDLVLAYSVDNEQGSERTTAIIQLLIRIQEARVSLAPFEDKLREGAAKRVDPQRLEKALNRIFEAYKFVDSLLSHTPTKSGTCSEEDCWLLVNSLELGLERIELREVIRINPAAPVEMLAVAAQNKALLKQMVFDNALIDDILSTGLSNQNFSRNWLSFYRLVAAARKKGLSDNRIAQAAIDGLKHDGDLRQVLTSLNFRLRDVRHGPHVDINDEHQ